MIVNRIVIEKITFAVDFDFNWNIFEIFWFTVGRKFSFVSTSTLAVMISIDSVSRSWSVFNAKNEAIDAISWDYYELYVDEFIYKNLSPKVI